MIYSSVLPYTSFVFIYKYFGLCLYKAIAKVLVFVNIMLFARLHYIERVKTVRFFIHILFHNRDEAWILSPINYVEEMRNNIKCRVLCMIAEQESPEFHKQSSEFYQVC